MIKRGDSNGIYITQDAMQASLWLKQGQILAYPTESVWGLGCDAYNESAVQQILKIKNRPIEKGLIVITDSADRLQPLLAHLSTSQRQAVLDSWQQVSNAQYLQAQTWLLPLISDHNIPKWITGNHNSIAVRVMVHPLIKQLSRHMVSHSNPYGFVVSTSCNATGKPPATTFSEAHAYFGKQINYLQAETLGYTQPSQIKDALTAIIIR